MKEWEGFKLGGVGAGDNMSGLVWDLGRGRAKYKKNIRAREN